MKSINFINALSAKHQKQLIRWYQTSILLFIAIMSGIIIITFKQYSLLSKLKKEEVKSMAESTEFDSIVSAKHALKQQELALKQKLETIGQFEKAEKNPATLLEALQKTVGDSAWIESITLEKTNLSLIILCSQNTQAMNIMNDLQKSPYLENLALLSLQPKPHDEHTFLRLTMKATWKGFPVL